MMLLPLLVAASAFVVDWKDGTTQAQFDEWEKAYGVDVHYNSKFSAEEALTIGETDAPLDALIERLRKDAHVEHAEPLYEYQALFVPDDPRFKNQWHLDLIGMRDAWDFARGEGVTVAVIDTGIARVPDLAGTAFAEGYDFVNDDGDAADDNGHGTHVAGTIAQTTNNAEGVAGVAYAARLMPVKVLNAGGAGTSADIADAIRWAADHGAKVLNLSLGGGGRSEVMADAVEYARGRGAVVVCAAGNGGGPGVSYPAAYPGAFAVSAVRFDRKLAPYSSFGPEVDIAAPGGDKSVDLNKDGEPDGVLQQTIARGGRGEPSYEWFQGTSMATPHVAGAAALLASAGVTRGEAIEALLVASASDAGPKDQFGAGILDASAAVRSAVLWAGLRRALIALGLGWLLSRAARRRDLHRAKLGAAYWGAAAASAAGLFFLPLLGLGRFPVLNMLSLPVPEWGMAIFGAGASSPLFHSALIPFALGLVLFSARSLAAPLAGLAVGFAAFMADGAFMGRADIAWIPGRWVEAAFYAANAIVCIMLARGFLRRVKA